MRVLDGVRNLKKSVDTHVHCVLCFALLVDQPKTAYKGQYPNNPVSKGNNPIHPQADFGPQNVNEIRNNPIIIRITRSVIPTFIFTVIASSVHLKFMNFNTAWSGSPHTLLVSSLQKGIPWMLLLIVKAVPWCGTSEQHPNY